MDDLRKVRPGDRLRVTSKAWNRVVDGLAVKPEFDASSNGYTPINFRVMCRNQTGQAVPRWGILQITGIAVPVPGGDQQFQDWPAIVGATPATGPAPYVVAIEPMADGVMGRVAIDGVVQVKLEVVHAMHGYANPKPGSVAEMKSDHSGTAEILWKESGTGSDKWALVRFNGRGPATRLGKITGTWDKGATAAVYHYSGDGVQATGSPTFEAINRFATIDATGPTGAWVACSIIDSRWHLIAAECDSLSAATGATGA